MAVYPRVLSFAYSRSSRVSCDVEAIVMDVVTNTYRLLDQGREINDLVAFMCTGVRHALIDHRRRSDPVLFEVIGERYDDIPDSEETTNPLVMSEIAETQVELRNWYLAALKRVKTRTRRGYAVMRLKLQGLSLEEIASKLGLSSNTIQGYMRKARAIVIPEEQRRKALIK
jgi:RNA polymerase sigma factor (sigma-70 family)